MIDSSLMIKKTLERSLTLFLLVIVVLAACATQAPIAVYITPTPPTSLDAAAPTEISEASSTGFTLTSMQTDSNSQPHPTVTALLYAAAGGLPKIWQKARHGACPPHPA